MPRRARFASKHRFSPWRHGGWYVDDIRYPSGACGCVSNNYPDRKWRIACDRRPNPPTFRSREAAADAEAALTAQIGEELIAEATAAGGEFIAGLDQHRAGLGAAVTPWLRTKAEAAHALLGLLKNSRDAA